MEKETFLSNFEREYQVTKRVLEAYPNDKLEMKPHPKLRTARDIASIFVWSEAAIPGMLEKGTIGAEELGKIHNTSVHDIVAELEKHHRHAVEAIKKTPTEKLMEKMDFFGMQIRVIDALWFFVMDAIHHRGQFSIYLRLAGAKVPPIYGPTADYPKGEADLQ